MSNTLGLSDVTAFLTENLNEELAAPQNIKAAASPIFEEALSQPEEEEEGPKTGKEKYSAKKSKDDEKKAAPEIKRRVAAR